MTAPSHSARSRWHSARSMRFGIETTPAVSTRAAPLWFVVERGSSCPTLTFGGSGRKLTVAMPLSGGKQANSLEAYTMLADALSNDILPKVAATIMNRLNAGETVTLAGRTISSHGMTHNKGVLQWSTLRSTSVAKGKVVFDFGTKVSIAASKDDAFVLAAVAEAMQGRRLQLPRSIVSNSKSSKAATKPASKRATAIVCGLAAAIIIACVVLLKFG
jgi:hypothetical protein